MSLQTVDIMGQTCCQTFSDGTSLTFIGRERFDERELVTSPLQRSELQYGKYCRILVKTLPC